MLRSLLRAAASSTSRPPQCGLSKTLPRTAAAAHQLTASRSFASKKKGKKKDSGSNPANQKLKQKGKKDGSDDKLKPRFEEVPITPTEELVAEIQEHHRRRLAEDFNNKALDVGPNGRPLFTSTTSLSQLTRKDTCRYMEFR